MIRTLVLLAGILATGLYATVTMSDIDRNPSRRPRIVIELVGGPHDGLTLTMVRMPAVIRTPVDGLVIDSWLTGEPDVEMADSDVALYCLRSWRSGRAVYDYAGRPTVGTP